MDDTPAAHFEYGNDGPSVIMVGVDGSATSLRAGAFAAGLARRERARLVCVFVKTVPGYVSLAAGGLVPTPIADDEVTKELRRLVHEGTVYHGVSAELVVTQGDPLTELTRMANELHADMVMVGASTHAGHRLIGSLAVRLVRAGHWPVTVVP
jgi:nucleotide-binding universal stress UspA family protein